MRTKTKLYLVQVEESDFDLASKRLRFLHERVALHGGKVIEKRGVRFKLFVLEVPVAPKARGVVGKRDIVDALYLCDEPKLRVATEQEMMSLLSGKEVRI